MLSDEMAAECGATPNEAEAGGMVHSKSAPNLAETEDEEEIGQQAPEDIAIQKAAPNSRSRSSIAVMASSPMSQVSLTCSNSKWGGLAGLLLTVLCVRVSKIQRFKKIHRNYCVRTVWNRFNPILPHH
jgi:hypothetical protein